MAVRLGELLLAPAWAEIKKEAIEDAWRNCVIVLAKLGERIGDIAALCVAKYNMEYNRKGFDDGKCFGKGAEKSARR